MNQHAEPFLKDAQALDDFTQVHVSRPHESAHLHVSGRATYTDDIPTVYFVETMPDLRRGRAYVAVWLSKS